MAGMLLRPKGMKSFGRYGGVGLELLLAIGVGYYFGRWVDGKLGTRWFALVGFLLGCYAGFRALFRTAKQMQIDIEREEKLERGEDPWAASVDDSHDDISPQADPKAKLASAGAAADEAPLREGASSSDASRR